MVIAGHFSASMGPCLMVIVPADRSMAVTTPDPVAMTALAAAPSFAPFLATGMELDDIAPASDF
jgi:hypothetical protein